MTKRTFLTISSAAAVLRLALIWSAPLWYDENFTYLVSALPFGNMMRAIIGDVHPPLYYLLVWPLGQIPGLPGWMLRLPSVAFSLAGLWLMWRIMDSLFISPRVQVITLSLLAILPFQILYAQEARMYALLECEVLLAVYAVLSRRWWMVTLALAAALYTQNYGLFYAPIIWIVGLVRFPRDWKPITLSVACAGLTWLPWMPVMFQQMHNIDGNYWIFNMGIGSVLATLYQMFWAFAFGPLKNIAIPVMYGTYLWLIASFSVYIMHIFQERKASSVIVFMIALGPMTIAILVSMIWNPILLFRPLIGSTPFLILICAWSLSQLTTSRSKLLAACVLLPLFVMGVGSYYINNGMQKESSSGGTSTALTYIESHWQPGDVLYHAGDSSLVNWLPYSRNLAHIIKPDCDRRAYGALTTLTRSAFGVAIEPLDGLNASRAWIVWSWSALTPQCELDQMNALIGDAVPVIVIENTKWIYAAVWLVNR
jgi:uncharacterized membrane protein